MITKPIPSDPLSCLYTSISQTDFNYGYKFCIADSDISSIQGLSGYGYCCHDEGDNLRDLDQ